MKLLFFVNVTLFSFFPSHASSPFIYNTLVSFALFMYFKDGSFVQHRYAASFISALNYSVLS